MVNTKYLSDGTVLIIQKQIIERCKIDTFNIYIVDVVEWSRALDVRLSEWCCSVTMV
jgi:hypothetical protein